MSLQLDLQGLRLFGRDSELAQLDSILKQSLSGVQVCFLEGASGSGKSALLSAIAQRHACFQGYGKFEEDLDEPIAAFIACLDHLIDQLTGDMMLRLQNELPEELVTLSRIMPSLHDITDLQMDAAVEDDSRSSTSRSVGMTAGDASGRFGFSQLSLAVRSFLRTLGRSATVLLLLDDLQWADEGSLRLLRSIVADPQANSLMIVGTHRPLGDDHPVLELRKDMGAVAFTNIAVRDLTPGDVEALLADLLQRHGDGDVRPLSDAIHRKTSGNAFFVCQLIHLAHARSILYYSWNNLRWEWDLVRLASEIDVSDNVVDVVLAKLRLMPERLQECLWTAAFLGPSRFEVRVLAKVVHRSDPCKPAMEAELEAELDRGVKEGLLEELDGTKHYKFAHDRIRESAAGLVNLGDARAAEHQRAGRILAKLVDEDDSVDQDGLVLLAAHHLNEGSVSTKGGIESKTLVVMNQRAARISFTKSSYNHTARFLDEALRHLGETRWKTDYDWTLELSSNLAYALFCSGRMDACKTVVDEILDNACSLEDKIPAYKTLALCVAQQSGPDVGREIILDVLDKLGIHLPRRFVKWRLIRRVIKAKRILQQGSAEVWLKLPQASDDFRVDAISHFLPLLTQLGIVAGRYEWQALSGILGIEITLEMGYTEVAAGTATAAAALLAKLGDLKRAFHYADVALKLVDRGDFPRGDGRAIVYAVHFVLHWRMSYHSCMKQIIRASNLLRSVNALDQLFFCMFDCSLFHFLSGLSLSELRRQAVKSLEMLKEYGQVFFFALYQAMTQLALRLTDDHGGDPTKLTGDGMVEEVWLAEWSSKKHLIAVQLFWMSKTFLAYYFNDYELANHAASKLRASHIDSTQPWVPPRVFFEGLIAFALARKRPRRRKHRKRGLVRLRKLESYFRQGNLNCHHMMLLLRAEHLALGNDNPKSAYDEAITAAARLGYIHNQALSNERAGIYFLEYNESDLATTYLSRACDLYAQWGATAKVTQMERK